MEDQSKLLKISILGLGLIGGSLAKSVRRSGIQCSISAFDKAEVLTSALHEGVIDEILSIPEESTDSDIVFLCLPVEISLQIFKQISPLLKTGSIITDVCGVKGIFENTWQTIASEGVYIGGHPMTGKEKGGYDNSDPLLFENSVYIISERAKDLEQKDVLFSIIKAIGGRIVFLDPFVHDKVVANVSHLPQLLSVALVNSAASGNSDVNNIDFAAGGFRDMTRIASSDFNIWKAVFKLNRKEILLALVSLQQQLSEIKRYIETNDSEKVGDLFEAAREKRDSIPKSTKGFMNPLYDIFVYVKDEPGIISIISTALFKENINIKDIELLKIREGTVGTFRLSFESSRDAENAKTTLNSIGFKFSS